jgi:hypothetical protein
MQENLAGFFIQQMQKQFDRRRDDGIETMTMDRRDEGLDCYATLGKETPLSYYCRGTRYVEHPDGTFAMIAGDGTSLPIDENEYLSRLNYALSCIGASSETGVSVLVKKHLQAE